MVPEDVKRILFSLLCCIGVAAFLATCFLSLQSHTRKVYMTTDQDKTVEYLHALEDHINAACSKVQRKTIVVSKVRLGTLLRKEAMLDALIAEGVEDWEGYFEATERIRGRGDNHEDEE